MNNKTDLRIVKTHQALHTAFTALLEEKSFEEITVNELCDKAMIRRTTFYKHFTDKYEYFKFYLNEINNSFKYNISSESKTTDLVSYSQNMLHEMFSFIREHEKLVDRMRTSNMMTFLYQSLLEQFTKELRYVFTSELKTTITPELELLISFYAGGLMNIAYWWLENPDAMDEDTVVQYIIKYLTPPQELLSSMNR